MLSLERLRVLHAVHLTGSVSGAAENLHVTTSAVSQQLARLEREIGQRLLERNGRGVRLTDTAVVLAGHAETLLTQVERIEADLAERAGTVAGTLSIAAFATAARGLLPDALRTLRSRHPALAVRLSELEPPDAIRGLARADLDIAIVQDWADSPLALPPGLSRRTLLTDPLDVALPADHPLAGRDTVALTELADEGWIGWTAGQLCHDWLTTVLRANGTEPVIAHTASEHSTQLALVAAGIGAAIIPRLGRERVPDGVRMIPLRPAGCRTVHVLWRTATARRPAIGAALHTIYDTARAATNQEPAGGT